MKKENIYQKRRLSLLKKIHDQGGGVAFFPSASKKQRTRDINYSYRQDSYFYYLTGFSESNSILVLHTFPKLQSILFCSNKNPIKAIWEGEVVGPSKAMKDFAFDAAYPIQKFDEFLASYLEFGPKIFYPSHQENFLQYITKYTPSKKCSEKKFLDILPLVDGMRAIKEKKEIELIRKACDISVEAHKKILTKLKKYRWEYEIDAELRHSFHMSGAPELAYMPIVASGKNSCVLHYEKNESRLVKGKLVLVDAGCEYKGYAADITRTYPINGQFNPEQRDLYEIVLAAQKKALKEIFPGQTCSKYHETACYTLAQGLVDLRICQGNAQEVMEKGEYRKYYMHNTGHFLGLDVHDPGADFLIEGEKTKRLAPGVVLTVEPGLYIRPAKHIPKAFWNIGIRIEDDVLVTENGNEILTDMLPKEINEIEAILGD